MTFAQDISAWDTSSVTNLEFMFVGCKFFTGVGIGAWDTSAVRTMTGCFCGTPISDGGIGAWDVSSACVKINN